MSIEGKIIGVDLDGVCADFYKEIRVIAAEWLECEQDVLTTDVTYGLPEWGLSRDQYKNLHRFAVTQRDLFKNLPMISGARKYLWRLSNEKARIRIITHRLFIADFHQLAVSQTIEWLDTNSIPYWDLCFMKEKDQVGADIYIEDNPSQIENLRNKRLYTICFANSTNTNVTPPRAKSWKEVYQLIHEQVDP